MLATVHCAAHLPGLLEGGNLGSVAEQLAQHLQALRSSCAGAPRSVRISEHLRSMAMVSTLTGCWVMILDWGQGLLGMTETGVDTILGQASDQTARHARP